MQNPPRLPRPVVAALLMAAAVILLFRRCELGVPWLLALALGAVLAAARESRRTWRQTFARERPASDAEIPPP